ncbi:Propionyl-CoA carboxylase, biotin carboxylase and biotin-carboxyl carrier subunit [Vanrija pseudolonga]|uniref:acetyl-CoA carboxylase n=1 Tax=Vanrija pseudolonga TaxID=143232 RepID=A0AAF1BMJ4_9TREE|nr:Propionyl-CoA carboxylase, biotin carboxylase and biotin-carboxyl carrier subunit [Vanrija pseudolonga]
MTRTIPNRPLRILVANRGEISLRLQASILALGHVPLGIYTAHETAHAPHLLHLDRAQRLLIPGDGARAYLDIPALIAVATEAKADAVMPGYGFLSESPEFAQAVTNAGMVWIGPRPETLALYGDKYASKKFADEAGVPVLPSTSSNASLAEIQAFAKGLPKGTKVLLKALEGGGGRGIRIAQTDADIPEAYESCKREALASFGSDKVFAEPFLVGARHIEVQIVGDGKGGVRGVGERECSLQRRHQKVIELCPSPSLVNQPAFRAAIIEAARTLAAKGKFLSLATFEFLVLAPTPESKGYFYFLECNPRIQVEHTVTEEAYGGIDLAAAQIRTALGEPLDAVLPPIPATPPHAALQLRVNAERFLPDANAVGTTGTLTSFVVPSGPGVRLDTAAHPPLGGEIGAYKQGLAFDSLLAKITVVAADYPSTVAKARRVLEHVRIGGVGTNRALLVALTESDNVIHNRGVSTRFVEQNFDALHKRMVELEKQWAAQATAEGAGKDAVEPGWSEADLPPAAAGQAYIKTHLPGRLVSLTLKEGAAVRKGDAVAILESMKMEHTVRSEVSGTVVRPVASEGDSLDDGAALALITVDENANDDDGGAGKEEAIDLDFKPPTLVELESVRAEYDDDHAVRQKGTGRRRARGYRTARENLNHLVDFGSFTEYGDLAQAAQASRLSPANLAATRNDGVIVGWGKVNGWRTAACIYDYAVLAGTQGHFHHLKLDRMFKSVLDNPAPLVLYAEGGGGRPGDVDVTGIEVAGLNTPSFTLLAHVNARGIPIVGIANGNLFAGNAALLGCSDFIIATDDPGTSIGMGGPAMIEGGGLGVLKPEEVGPVRTTHLANGNVDILVKDEAEATDLAKTLIAIFQPPLRAPQEGRTAWYSRDTRLFRHVVPIDRKRAYDIHSALDLLSDDGTPFLEVGKHWGQSLITGFVRVKGVAVGVLASNVLSPLGGAVDAPSARKGSRFLNILTKTRAAHVITLCDTPGFMVGTAAEKEGGLKDFPAFFAACAAFTDSGGRFFGLTVRKAYGLGVQALLGGSTLVPFHSAAWPTGEFGGMGIEGAVKLGYSKELAAVADPKKRAELEKKFVDELYVRGRAINMAQKTEIDTVIDPAETRDWLERCLDSVEPRVAWWLERRSRGGWSRL